MPKDGSKRIYLLCVSSSTGKIVIISHDRIKILNIRQKKAKVGHEDNMHLMAKVNQRKIERSAVFVVRERTDH